MTRSRLRKLKRLTTAKRSGAMLSSVPIAAAALMCVPTAHSAEDLVLEQVIVTAQKRTENLQEVPLSIQALGTETLEELRISDFDDYVRYLPTVSYTTFGPGFAQVYMRGVASGGDGNHSGSLPSVGIYLDEQPITTIQGALDVHLYDIARVEALAGPQGTLYGASSQAGTLRIITNKPDATEFKAGYDLEGSSVSGGEGGYLAEGFANVPLGDRAAIRLVGWVRHDPGYIDNVSGSRTFTNGIVSSNAGFEKDDYNDIDTYGARAALKIDLNDNWTVTPQLMAQKMEGNGTFGFDPTVGDLKVAHKFKEKSDDEWYLGSLTLEGKIGNLDMVYAGSYLKRDVDTFSDYSDYSYWYDVAYAAAGYDFTSYFYDNAGDPIDFSQYIEGKDRYKRYAHELRFSTPSENRVRFVGGAFLQRQEHDIQQRYKINDLADTLEVSLWPDTLWLTEQTRVDEDRALFGELTFDITEKLSATGGVRYFETDNSLKGFFGFGAGFSGSTGEAACFDQGDYNGAPCVNLDKDVSKDDFVYKANLTYKITDDKMVYLTYSEGFRPGGINRRGTLPPYLPDYLTSYELGVKTTWADNFRINVALFSQEWEDFQFSLLGANGLTEIKNANQARINGIEGDFSWAVTGGFILNGGFAYLDSELTENYCGFVKEGTSIPETVCDAPEAPEGTELPVTPKFKGNLTGRFEFPIGSFDGHAQASLVYVGKRWADLRIEERAIIGELPDYTTVDLSAGMGSGSYSFELFLDNATDERAELTRFAQCAEATCGAQTYVVTTRPRTFGLRFGQKF